MGHRRARPARSCWPIAARCARRSPRSLPATSFGYHIEPASGPLKPLVSAAEGTWAFAPAGTGVEVSWQWVVEPTRAGTRWRCPPSRRMWQGYARQALEEIERALLAAT